MYRRQNCTKCLLFFFLFFNIFEIHHEKYVQISTNMTSIGLEIHEVRRFSIKNMVLKMAACISI